MMLLYGWIDMCFQNVALFCKELGTNTTSQNIVNTLRGFIVVIESIKMRQLQRPIASRGNR